MVQIAVFFIENIIAISNISFPYMYTLVTGNRTYINKGCNLLHPYLLTVLLSIPFDKLP